MGLILGSGIHQPGSVDFSKLFHCIYWVNLLSIFINFHLQVIWSYNDLLPCHVSSPSIYNISSRLLPGHWYAFLSSSFVIALKNIFGSIPHNTVFYDWLHFAMGYDRVYYDNDRRKICIWRMYTTRRWKMPVSLMLTGSDVAAIFESEDDLRFNTVYTK